MDADIALGFLVPVLNLSKKGGFRGEGREQRSLPLEKPLSPPASHLMGLLPLCLLERKDSSREPTDISLLSDWYAGTCGKETQVLSLRCPELSLSLVVTGHSGLPAHLTRHADDRLQQLLHLIEPGLYVMCTLDGEQS